MEFFGREDEIRKLRRIREIARKNARFTVLTGRRRVGKTELVCEDEAAGKLDFYEVKLDEKRYDVEALALKRAAV